MTNRCSEASSDESILHGPPRSKYIAPVPKKPERQFNVGDKIRVNMHAGKIVDAVVRAIIPETDGLRLQVDFGFEQTALIHVGQVVED
jgi:transcription antitermination factor NusG